ncbi:MAG: hypothetical protein ACOCV3_06385 [Halanaerobiales bacterium]
MPEMRNVVIYIIIFIFIFSFVQPVYSSSDVIPVQKLEEVEEILYDESEDGSIIDRVEEIEKTLYGEKQEGTLVERAVRIIDYVLAQEERPSLIFIVNTLEWSLMNEINDGNVVSRLENIENKAFGQSETGPVVDRVSRLVRLGLPREQIPAERVKIPSNTEIKIETLNTISSISSQKGQVIEFEVTEEVEIDDKLIIPKGLRGKMKVGGVEEAGKLGKDGRVMLEIDKLPAIDGTRLTLSPKLGADRSDFLNSITFDGRLTLSRYLAVGTGVITSVLIDSPAGLILSYFIKGREEEIPEGSEMVLETVEDYEVYGLVTK